MRRIFVVMGALLLLVALAGAQATVIKYAVPIDLSDYSSPAIGDVVEMNSEDSLVACDAGTDALGFIAMIESDGTHKWAVIVNAGVISAIVHGGVSAGDSLTVDGTNPGDLKAAEVGDRVVAVALEDISDGSSGNVLVTGVGPIASATGAKIWQAAVTSMTDITGTSASRQNLASISITDCGAEYMSINFTGTADDRTGSGGAVVNVAINNGSSDLATGTVYLVDLVFYQSQSIALSATEDVSPTDDPTYTVQVWESNGLTNGRIKGVLTVIGTPRGE